MNHLQIKTFLLTKVKYKELNENEKFSLNLRKRGELFLKTTFKNYRKVWLLGGSIAQNRCTVLYFS